MKDLVSSLFPEKGRRVAIFGSLMQGEEGIGATWSWASANGDGSGGGWYWGEGESGKLWREGRGIGAEGGRFWLACMRAKFCVKWTTCWVRSPTFAINICITVMVSANWFSKFDDVEVVPDSWDMSEKVGEVECSSVKERAMVREQ